jgi:hypothetical protein
MKRKETDLKQAVKKKKLQNKLKELKYKEIKE